MTLFCSSIILLLGTSRLGAQQAPALRISQAAVTDSILNATAALQFYDEAEGKRSATDVQQDAFAPLPLADAKPFIPLDVTHTYWVRLPLQNTDSTRLELVLTLSGKHHAGLQLFVLRAGTLTALPIANAASLPQRRESLSIHLLLQPHEQATLLFHWRAQRLAVSLASPAAYQAHYQAEEAPSQMLLFMFYGMSIIMFIYNLFLLFTVRDKSYLYYSLYLAGITLFLWIEGNQSQYYFGSRLTFYTVYLGNMCIAAGYYGILTFVRTYLHTREDHKLIDKLLLAGYAANTLMVAVNYYAIGAGAVPAKLYAYLQQPVSLFIILACMAAIVRGMIHGYRPANWLLFAFTPLVFAGFVFIFARLNIIDANAFTDNVIYFGSALEAALLSIALGGRINLMKAERNRAERQLSHQIQQQNIELEMQVAARTRELQEKNVELEHQKEEVLQQKEEIEAINENLSDANRKVAEQNNDMLASITYAQRIQQAMMDREVQLKPCFASYFLLNKPKDILSGDFYWFGHLGDLLILAVVDCTGHGVPGSYVSLLGYGLLNRIILEEQLTNPVAILTELDVRVRQIFRQDEAKPISQDGMDVSLCVVNTATKKLAFANAKRPALLVQQAALIEVPADRDSIGGATAYPKRFTLQEYSYAAGDSFYLFTDGFTDQFDAENKKRYSYSRLREQIAATMIQPLEEQKHALENVYAEWRGTTMQTDDKLMLAVQLR